MEIIYKILDENDILNQKEEIIKLFELLFIDKSEKKIIEMYYANMIEYCRDGTAILLGAFYQNTLIGFHWGYEISWGGIKRIHSYFIAVNEDYQKMSIGSQLQNNLEKIAISRGIYYIDANCEVHNKKSYEYHLKQGFEIESYRMVKNLNKID